MKTRKNILVYGYGNPGRQDDGLGIAMIDLLESWIDVNEITHIQLDRNYQLNIEDATVLNGKDFVIFVDASVDDNTQKYKLVPVQPSPKVAFTMHATTPGFILHLCKEMFDTEPVTWLMHIKGLAWEMKEELSTEARNNLQEAFEYLKDILMDPARLPVMKETHV